MSTLFWGGTLKEAAAAVTWVLYVAFFAMRHLRGMRGRKTVYVSMAGFAGLLLAIVGAHGPSNLGGPHP